MMPDPIDELSARLFATVRQEPTPEGAEQRALERAQRERARLGARRVTGLLLLAAAFALVAAFVIQRREAPSPIAAEPALPSGHARNHAPAEPPRVDVPASAPPSEPSATPARPKSVASAPRAVELSLDDELTTLKAAEGALGAGDAQGALKLLNQYDAGKGQRMRAEATLLRIEALAHAGQPLAASKLAQSFVDANQGSPLVDRARSFIVQEKSHE